MFELEIEKKKKYKRNPKYQPKPSAQAGPARPRSHYSLSLPGRPSPHATSSAHATRQHGPSTRPTPLLHAHAPTARSQRRQRVPLHFGPASAGLLPRPPHAQPSITLSRAPDLPASQLRALPGPLVSPVRPAFPGPLASRSARTTHARSAAFSLTSRPRLSAPPPRSPH